MNPNEYISSDETQEAEEEDEMMRNWLAEMERICPEILTARYCTIEGE